MSELVPGKPGQKDYTTLTSWIQAKYTCYYLWYIALFIQENTCILYKLTEPNSFLL